jgi:hypothetical protein
VLFPYLDEHLFQRRVTRLDLLHVPAGFPDACRDLVELLHVLRLTDVEALFLPVSTARSEQFLRVRNGEEDRITRFVEISFRKKVICPVFTFSSRNKTSGSP